MSYCSLPEVTKNQSPYTSHASVLHAVSDQRLVNQLQNSISNTLKTSPHKIIFYQQSTQCQPEAPQTRIQNQIYSAHKCIFFLTPAYIQDDYKLYTSKIASERAKGLKIHDFAFVILRSSFPGKDEDELKKLPEQYGLQDCDNIFIYDNVTSEELIERISGFICSGRSDICKMDLPTDMGKSLALAYFFGYLSIKIPELASAVRKDKPGLFHAPDDEQTIIMPEAYFIIIPDSLYCPPILTELDHRITSKTRLKFPVSRGGIRDRDFSTAIHEIRLDNKLYRFMGEVPNILVNLYDMQMEDLPGVKSIKRLVIQQFYDCLDDLIQSHGNCRGKIQFIFYKDGLESRCQGPADTFIKLLIQAIEEEVKVDIVKQTVPSDPCDPQESHMKRNRTSFYDCKRQLVREYSSEDILDQKLGPAYIINNKYKSPTGTDAVEEQLKTLLEKLNFEPIVKRNLKAEDMHRLSNDWFRIKEKHKAFFCAFIGHGNMLGQLEGYDRRPVNLGEMTDVLQRCDSLADATKILLIEASEGQEDSASTCLSTEMLSLDIRASEESERRAVVERRQSTATANHLLTGLKNHIGIYSSTPGAVTGALHGADFIKLFCKEMNDNVDPGWECDLHKTFDRIVQKSKYPTAEPSYPDLGVREHTVDEKIPNNKLEAFITGTPPSRPFSSGAR